MDNILHHTISLEWLGLIAIINQPQWNSIAILWTELEAYECTYLVDKDSDEDLGDNKPLDVVDDALGPNGKRDVDSLVFASF